MSHISQSAIEQALKQAEPLFHRGQKPQAIRKANQQLGQPITDPSTMRSLIHTAEKQGLEALKRHFIWAVQHSPTA